MHHDDVKQLRQLCEAVAYADGPVGRRQAYDEAVAFVKVLRGKVPLVAPGQPDGYLLEKLDYILFGLKRDAKLEPGDGFTTEAITSFEDRLADHHGISPHR